MEYVDRLVAAAQEYLRKSTCKCGYKDGFCPQEVLQSIIEERKLLASPPIPSAKKNRRGKK